MQALTYPNLNMFGTCCFLEKTGLISRSTGSGGYGARGGREWPSPHEESNWIKFSFHFIQVIKVNDSGKSGCLGIGYEFVI